MHRHFLKSAIAVAAVAGMAILGSASPARAVQVQYSTFGIFTGGDEAGSSVYVDAARGIRIEFDGIESDLVNVPPPSQASFGFFDTSGTTATSLQEVDSGFTLTIFQTLPETPEPGGELEFVGQLDGTLSIDASGAFVLFQGPLSGTITGPLGSMTTYTIIEADEDTVGRANINPFTTAEGRSSVDGLISTTTAAPIPEPSTLLMGALAVPAVLICLRKKGKVTV